MMRVGYLKRLASWKLMLCSHDDGKWITSLSVSITTFNQAVPSPQAGPAKR